ncbi:MAG: Trm112 family protein [Candidatus Omnitrophica bacterium]|nr:Trm112 family protein [Candidatus Omnitrophota bacterium]
MIKPELMNILACPACKSSLRQEEEKLVCSKCMRKFPIRNGIPILLLSETEGDERP